MIMMMMIMIMMMMMMMMMMIMMIIEQTLSLLSSFLFLGITNQTWLKTKGAHMITNLFSKVINFLFSSSKHPLASKLKKFCFAFILVYSLNQLIHQHWSTIIDFLLHLVAHIGHILSFNSLSLLLPLFNLTFKLIIKFSLFIRCLLTCSSL